MAGRPLNPTRVPPPTDPLKAPVKYGVGGGRHWLGGIETTPHNQLVGLAKAGHREGAQ